VEAAFTSRLSIFLKSKTLSVLDVLPFPFRRVSCWLTCVDTVNTVRRNYSVNATCAEVPHTSSGVVHALFDIPRAFRRSRTADGSCIVVIATDAPVDARNLKRMGARAMMVLARTGAEASNGSGDYAIAFTTVRPRPQQNPNLVEQSVLSNDAVSPLFLALIEATEEAVYNSLLRATTVTGNGHTVGALPLERTLEILRPSQRVGDERRGRQMNGFQNSPFPYFEQLPGCPGTAN